MSTFFHPELACPACGAVSRPAIIKGLHVTRLPEVREAILDGTFQRFTCACGNTLRVERTGTVYTDFSRGHYVAVASRHLRDWRAAKATHLQAWDEAFTFGPGVAVDLSEGMRHRLVFGVLALREKLMLWDADLDDLSVEAAKGDALRERGLSLEGEELRLSRVLDGGHLLFMRLAPPDRVAAGPDGVTLLPPLALRGHVMVPRARYLQRLRQREAATGDYPWLGDDWVVDLLVTHPARA